jgi:hypothetical protein
MNKFKSLERPSKQNFNCQVCEKTPFSFTQEINKKIGSSKYIF